MGVENQNSNWGLWKNSQCSYPSHLSSPPNSSCNFDSTTLYNSIILKCCDLSEATELGRTTGLDILEDYDTKAITCETGMQTSPQVYYLLLKPEPSRTLVILKVNSPPIQSNYMK